MGPSILLLLLVQEPEVGVRVGEDAPRLPVVRHPAHEVLADGEGLVEPGPGIPAGAILCASEGQAGLAAVPRRIHVVRIAVQGRVEVLEGQPIDLPGILPSGGHGLAEPVAGEAAVAVGAREARMAPDFLAEALDPPAIRSARIFAPLCLRGGQLGVRYAQRVVADGTGRVGAGRGLEVGGRNPPASALAIGSPRASEYS